MQLMQESVMASRQARLGANEWQGGAQNLNVRGDQSAASAERGTPTGQKGAHNVVDGGTPDRPPSKSELIYQIITLVKDQSIRTPLVSKVLSPTIRGP